MWCNTAVYAVICNVYLCNVVDFCTYWCTFYLYKWNYVQYQSKAFSFKSMGRCVQTSDWCFTLKWFTFTRMLYLHIQWLQWRILMQQLEGIFLWVFFHFWSSSRLEVTTEPRSALSDSKSVTSLRMSHEINDSTWILHCCLATFTHTGATLLSSLPPFLYSQKWVHTRFCS